MMVTFKSGEELSLEEPVKWNLVTVSKGDVVEVNLGFSDWEPKASGFAAFIVLQPITELDRSVRLLVRFLGAEEVSLSQSFKERFGEEGGYLHLCPSTPCVELVAPALFTLHVTKVRLWKWDDFKTADYLSQELVGKLPEWLAAAEPPREEEPKKKPQRRRATPASPAGDGRAKNGPPGKGVPGKEKPTGRSRRKVPEEPNLSGGEPAALSEEMRKKLRARLKDAKEKVGGPKDEVVTAPGDVEEVSDSGSGTVSSGCAQAGLGLSTGSGLTPLPPTMALELKKKEKRKKKRRSLLKDEQIVGVLEEGTNASTSKNWSGQLVRQAVLAVQDQGTRKKRSRASEKKKGAAEKLTEALTQLIAKGDGSGSGDKDKKSRKDKKKKRKKKKRKRRIRRDGVIESYSESSSTSSISEEERMSSSDEDLETPIRKKSRTSPGSILAMLTNHVREQLEQTAMVDLNAMETTVTGGVKILTYFTLQVKPTFGTHFKELRELHHLAMTMDTLRKGDIARTGDALAARFMAIHQSLIDQNWSAARHLELYPMEEASAASSGVILATRKHSRLVAKMQGLVPGGNWGGYGRGRGKGGRGEWQAYGDSKGEQKGKKGGKKGDGKGKGRGGSTWNSGKDDVNKWKDSKEKETEK